MKLGLGLLGLGGLAALAVGLVAQTKRRARALVGNRAVRRSGGRVSNED
ncbi:MAG: hypothetical protein ACRDX8_03685 [Acidimicrobiales bacterium]